MEIAQVCSLAGFVKVANGLWCSFPAWLHKFGFGFSRRKMTENSCKLFFIWSTDLKQNCSLFFFFSSRFSMLWGSWWAAWGGMICGIRGKCSPRLNGRGLLPQQELCHRSAESWGQLAAPEIVSSTLLSWYRCAFYVVSKRDLFKRSFRISVLKTLWPFLSVYSNVFTIRKFFLIFCNSCCNLCQFLSVLFTMDMRDRFIPFYNEAASVCLLTCSHQSFLQTK